MSVFLLQPDHLLPEVRRHPRLLVKLACLFGQQADQVFREDARISRYIEDVLLRVERRQLSAKLRKRIDQLRGRATHPGIEEREEASWPAADDRQVADFMGRHRKKIAFVVSFVP